MDIVDEMRSINDVVQTITMHTAGEPTRIIVKGYPPLRGETLLQKRRDAMENHDHIRKMLMHEPRGHQDMYGAILISDTELTRSGDADIGVLFCHNEGYSTMCGHATIALGRFLIDTQDKILFPKCTEVRDRVVGLSVSLTIHAPCGLVKVTVPIRYESTPNISSNRRIRSDHTRSVSFQSVPSFAACVDLELEVPAANRWPEILKVRNEHLKIKLDIAYGGAFYAIVRADELGFGGPEGRITYDKKTLRALDFATAQLKAILQGRIVDLLAPVAHLVEEDILFLYGVTVIDAANPEINKALDGAKGRDRNLCFFADQQLDRSPTGSCVSARVALDVTKKKLDLGDRWIFHSIASEIGAEADKEAFVGSVVETKQRWASDLSKSNNVLDTFVVQVEGRAWYVGTEAFVLEEKDCLGKGFLVDYIHSSL